MELMKVLSANYISNYVLEIAFNNGCTLSCNLEELVNSQGVFQTLKEISLFKKFRIENGVIEWAGDIDIAPEYLYKIGSPLKSSKKLPEPDYVHWAA